MTELLTAAQMRAIEQAAIDSGEVTGLELMERAGRGVVEAIFEEWPELASGQHHAVVLCGPGNNGGDGFVIARRLRDKGWQVEVFHFGDPRKLPPDAKRNFDVWTSMGDVQPLTRTAVAQGKRPVLLIDALFGTGITRAIPLDLAEAHHAVEYRDVGKTHRWRVPFHRVAVDCPSGFDTDSGQFLMPTLPVETGNEDEDADTWFDWWQNDASRRLLCSDLTLSFHREKVGHALNQACGKVRVVDIGLGKDNRHPVHLIQDRDTDRVTKIDFDQSSITSKRVWPGSLVTKRSAGLGHKYSYGHVLVMSGGPGRTGAARLSARGALRVGAGLVTLGVPPAAQQEVASQITAVMLERLADADALSRVLEDDRISALCLGPGMGLDTTKSDLIAAALKTQRPTVLDADALTLVSQASDLFDALHPDCVLTPHAGEFRRLFPDIADQLDALATTGPAYSKVDAARDAAKRAGCIVLFKGPDTVIAAPDGRCSINAALYERSAPWLATAGSGDVLAGFITGLLARGLPAMQAAEVGAWLHVECARAFGPGLIAEDLPEMLPKVFRDLGL